MSAQDYEITLEPAEGQTLIHCTVHRWTHRVLEAVRRDVDRALRDSGGVLLATSSAPHGGDRAKFAKFAVRMGFKFHCTIPHTDGRHRALYLRRE